MTPTDLDELERLAIKQRSPKAKIEPPMTNDNKEAGGE